MTLHAHLAVAIAIVGALITPAPALAQQPSAPPVDHSAHHPDAATPPAPASQTGAGSQMMSSAKLDELVKKMNAATGTAKTAAMAELLTALVAERHSCETMMANMMKSMHGDGGQMPMQPAAK